ncbi:MAG: ATP-binding protein [Candidatus Bathyarchaeia archaeon]|jgi:PAS domain S-box-containing protein
MRLRTQFLISLLVFAFVVAAFVSSVLYTNVQLAQLHVQRNTAEMAEDNASKLDYFFMHFLEQQNLTQWQNLVTHVSLEFTNLHSTNPKLVNIVILDLKKVNDTFHSNTPTINTTQLNQDISAFQNLWSTIENQTQQLASDAEQLSAWLQEQEQQMTQINLLLISALITSFLAYFVFMYMLVFRRTLKPIKDLSIKTKSAKEVTPKRPLANQPNDEIGDLSNDFDEILGELKQTNASKELLEREVSERKKAEAALVVAQSQLKDYANNLERIVEERTKRIVESEQSYHELYESFGEAFIAMDWELNVIHWNKAAERVTSVKAEQALGKKIYDVFPEMQSVDVTPYYESLRNKQPTRFQMNTTSRETGRLATFEISTYPSTQGIIIIAEDITEEEKIKRLSAIGQTASMVGHDIRNPLQAITSDVYLIREELKTVPEYTQREGLHESLNTIEENIFYINKIISDLQDYTRPLSPVSNEVKVKELLENILEGIRIPDNIEAEIRSQEDLAIYTDGDYLKRALSNLVMNAVQAMPNGGKLTLKTIKVGNKVQISVRDTGVGIPQETKDKIFTPLFTTKSKGQGLGLAVVKRLVEGLKGKITYESQEGKGTVFYVELPQKLAV